jgi:phosphopantothenoylcysteine decarboxylase / phosphopantothenate---cysteine ligase
MKEILSGKKIILGVTGCIAAYKSCLIARELISKGAEVKVIMTPSALEFITPLTLSTLTQNDVIINTFPADQKSGITSRTWHIDMALWADVMLIAPATINTIAKIAAGFADNALLTLVAALRCPLVISPAADVDMYQNPITQQNIKKLEDLGVRVIFAEEGKLASGLSGHGRLPEIEKIICSVESVLSGYETDFKGRKILVTAGPTYEDVDPVRYIGNRSSGKMGFQIAKAAFIRGAEVTLITGPVSQSAFQGINVINVRSAEEMKNAIDAELEKNEILIMSAAVADYKPETVADLKIKKEDGLAAIKLTKTVDILSSLKKDGKKIIGFALETNSETENALKKLNSKKLDMIVLNSLREPGSGFEHETNKVTVFHKSGEKKEYPLETKFQTANHILSEVKKII